MSLSVCLLTRNEEKNIVRVLRSVAGVADQVIVADTGSTDATVRLARELGAVVHPFTWTDDFAAGRNFALRQAAGDWILWLNPDEELLPDSQEQVRACMAQDDAFGFAVIVQEHVKADQPDAFTEVTQVRLFRRREDVRFLGRVHPHFAPPLAELARRENRRLYPSPIRVRHHAYLSQLSKAKLRWAARLLELELQDRPGQMAYLIEYGQTLLRLNDPKGHAVLAEATAQMVAGSDALTPPAPEAQRLLEYLLTVGPQHIRMPLSQGAARALALRWFPYSPPLIWLLAAQDFQAGNYRRAAELLEWLVRLEETGNYDRSESFDPSILGDNALLNLGACYLQLRELDKAEHCLRPLLQSQAAQARAAQYLEVVQSLRP
jgi:glycosyltransferase involved in cell wall biosynthesis